MKYYRDSVLGLLKLSDTLVRLSAFLAKEIASAKLIRHNEVNSRRAVKHFIN